MSATAVTPAGVRDGDPRALAGLCEVRGPAVLAYCELVAGRGAAATAAAADAFGSFRAGVAATQDLGSLNPETVLISATRHAAARHAGAELPPPCDRVPRLLAARADRSITLAEHDWLGEHLADCWTCRAPVARFDAADKAYLDPPDGPLAIETTAAILAAMAAAAPVRGVAPAPPPPIVAAATFVAYEPAPALHEQPMPAPIACEQPERAPIACEQPERAPIACEQPERAPIASEQPERAPIASEAPEPAPIAYAQPEPAAIAHEEPAQSYGGDIPHATGGVLTAYHAPALAQPGALDQPTPVHEVPDAVAVQPAIAPEEVDRVPSPIQAEGAGADPPRRRLALRRNRSPKAPRIGAAVPPAASAAPRAEDAAAAGRLTRAPRAARSPRSGRGPAVAAGAAAGAPASTSRATAGTSLPRPRRSIAAEPAAGRERGALRPALLLPVGLVAIAIFAALAIAGVFGGGEPASAPQSLAPAASPEKQKTTTTPVVVVPGAQDVEREKARARTAKRRARAAASSDAAASGDGAGDAPAATTAPAGVPPPAPANQNAAAAPPPPPPPPPATKAKPTGKGSAAPGIDTGSGATGAEPGSGDTSTVPELAPPVQPVDPPG